MSILDDTVGKEPALDVKSRGFQPKRFVRKSLADVTHESLEKELVDEVMNAGEEAGESLKQLLRDNLGTFIDSKDAMDAVYTSDRALFTGEALEDIMEAFEDTEEGCKTIIQPILDSYMDVQQSRRSQDILSKLYSVLNVPGTLYSYCGVRVAMLKSDLTDPMAGTVRWDDEEEGKENGEGKKDESGEDNGIASSSTKENKEMADDFYDEEDEEDDFDEEDEEEEDEEDDEDLSSVEGARGALEDVSGKDSAKAYILNPGEEVFSWYETPLVRLRNRDAQRSRVEEASNYEAATLSLRRAILYMEERYDMENGLVKDVTKDDEEEGRNKVSQFIYSYSLALLKAALYLNDQLAVELTYASAADTVLIEDILSMMMDISEFTTKLYHFCGILALKYEKKSENALKGLRTKLDEGASLAEEDPMDRMNSSNTAEEDTEKRKGTTGSGSGGTMASLKKLKHPVQHFINITNNEYTKLMVSSATDLVREATAWKGKMMRASSNKTGTTSGNVNRKDGGFFDSNGVLDTNFSFTDGGMSSFLGGNLFKDSFGNSTFAARVNGSNPMNDDDTQTEDTLSASVNFSATKVNVGDFRTNTGQAHAIDNDGVERHAESILEAFRTPEWENEKYTSFKVGKIDMTDALEGSCAQIKMHGNVMLKQIFDRSDTEAAIMSQGLQLNSFATRLADACMINLEHVFTSYWGGIATVIHSGLFDFQPAADNPLTRMLAQLIKERDVKVETKSHEKNTTKTVATNGAVSSEAGEEHDDEGGAPSQERTEEDRRISIQSSLPNLRFIPILVSTAAKEDGEPPTLRKLSVEVVRKIVQSASNVINSHFLAFVNQSVLLGFVSNIAAFTKADKEMYASSEKLELFAAILVEVIIGQWEKIMLTVSESVLRMKVAVGESCSTNSIKSDEQMEEIGILLEELEVLRSSCFKCYIHGIGMLSKAYITTFPFIIDNSKASLEKRIRPRLGRDFVSSVLPTKLINLFSVVVDRCVHFMHRNAEVFESSDLFAAKEGDAEDKPAPAKTKASSNRRRLLRKRRGGAAAEEESHTDVDDAAAAAAPQPAGDRIDAVTEFVAQCHSKLVLDHIAEHEELAQALVANLLLCFIDMLHLKSQSACGNTEADPDEQSKDVVESMADTLCIPTALIPILLDNLLTPCLFEFCCKLNGANDINIKSLLDQKRGNFTQNYLARVYEHAQLVVDAMMSIYLAIPQSSITQEVQHYGFIKPLFDWQRVSSLNVTSARPYVAECLSHVARAHEVLNWIHQPILGAAVTQKLVAHIAIMFTTALSTNYTTFEVSADCSTDFLTHGLLLMEAEGLVIIGVVDVIIDSITKNPKAGEVLPELLLAKETLQYMVTTLEKEGSGACEMLFMQADAAAVLTVSERNRRRDAIVRTSMEELQYMVEAISTQLEETTLPSALPQSTMAVASIAERLAKRSEGYQVLHRAKQQADEQEMAEDAKKKKKKTRKVKVTARSRSGNVSGEVSPPLPATPRREDEQQQQTVSAALLQNKTPDAQKTQKKRITRKARVTEPQEEPAQEEIEEETRAPAEEMKASPARRNLVNLRKVNFTEEETPSAAARPTTTRERPTRLAARAQARKAEQQKEEAAPPARETQRASRREARAAAEAQGEEKESAAARRPRRTRQFGRSNAI